MYYMSIQTVAQWDFQWSPNTPASQTSDLYVKSNMLCAVDMQFNSGGLEALVEANGVAMAPSGAVLLTGWLLYPVTAWNSGLLASTIHSVT